MHTLLRPLRLDFITNSHCAAPAGATAHRAPAVTHAQLQNRVAQFRHQHQLPGLGIVLVQNDTLLSACSGLRRIDAPEPMQTSDPYPLSALNHALIAMLIARWVEQGRLRWDATLAELLPAWREQMHIDYQDITLQQLLQHRAGLPRDLSAMNYPELFNILGGNPQADRATAVRWVLQQTPERPRQQHYSELGYMTAVIIIELLGGNTFDNLLQTQVLKPLDIHTHSALSTPVHGHQWAAKHWLSRPQWQRVSPHDETQLRLAKLNAANSICLSFADYGLILREHLRGLHGQSSWLQQASFQQLHTANTLTEPRNHLALGWAIIQSSQLGSVSAHDGAILGGANYTLLAPNKNLAVAVMCNGDSARTGALLVKFAESWLI